MSDSALFTPQNLLVERLALDRDCHHLTHAVIDAVEALGGDDLTAAARLGPLVAELGRTIRAVQEPIEVRLELTGDELAVVWGGHRAGVLTLAHPPAPEEVDGVVRRVRGDSARDVA